MIEPPYLAATRHTYDTVAASYAERITGLGAESSLDVAMIDTFAARVRLLGPVLDAGCGTGRMTAYLAGLGLDVSGIDLSRGMITQAERLFPHLAFEVGTMTDIARADSSVGGVLAWYSIIHTPAEHLPEVFAELHRVLVPGGPMLLGFHVGDAPLRLDAVYGHDVDTTVHLTTPDALAAPLRDAGFAVDASLERAPDGRERRPQGFVLAHRR